MRKLYRRNTKKTFVLASILFIVAFMAVGYSILSQNIFIDAEVNVLTAQKYLWYKITNEYVTTSGSGFYINEYENNKYSYMGNGNTNYISLNDELWRIVSVEADHTIKVVRWNDTLINKFDETDNRTASSTYCVDLTNGCNSWSSREIFENGTINGNVDNDSSLLTYLNTVYYNNLSTTFKNQIIEHQFNVGPVEQGTVFSQALMQEQEYTWNGKIGLLTITEMLMPTNSTTMSIGTSSYENNYLLDYASGKFLWTISPVKNSSTDLWTIAYDKTQVGKHSNLQTETISDTTYNYVVLPTVYLKNTVQYVSGNGSLGSPFVIS